MELLTALEGRRSVRKFKQEPVPKEILQEIIKAGSCAPKPSNRQQWEIIVVDRKDIIERLVKEAGSQEHVMAAPCLFVVAVDMEFNKEHWSNIQATAAACQNMQLRAFDLGYGSCVMAGFGDGRIVKNILEIPDPWEVTCFMMVGKPDEAPSKPPKKEVEEIIHHNKFVNRTERLPSSVRLKDWNLNQVRQHQKFVSRAYKMGVDYEFYDHDELHQMRDIIKQHLPTNGRILNLLGYDGTVLKNIQPLFDKQELIDCELSPEAAEFVKAKTKDLTFVAYSDKIERTEDNSIDLAIITFALEKIPEKDREKLIKEAHRTLKVGGKLILFHKNKASSYGLVYYSIVKLLGINHLEGFYVRSGPFEPISIYSTQKLLKDFSIQDKKGIFLLPAEIKIYTEKVNGYLHRHGHKLSVFKYLIKPGLWLGNLAFSSTKWVKNPYLSATSCLIATKR